MGKLRHGKGKLYTQVHPESQGQRCLSESKASYPHVSLCEPGSQAPALAMGTGGRLLDREPRGLGSRSLTHSLTLCQSHSISGPWLPAQSKERVNWMPSDYPS